jgi:import inner membrane translocase subunit TIM10
MTSEQKIAQVEGEMRMMADSYNRYAHRPFPFAWKLLGHRLSCSVVIASTVTNTLRSLQRSCQAKCIAPDYREPELNKGESVCLDRCVAKFLDASLKISDIMQAQAEAGGAGMRPGM